MTCTSRRWVVVLFVLRSRKFIMLFVFVAAGLVAGCRSLNSDHTLYEKLDVVRAEQRVGFAIPLPTRVPPGCELDGIYMIAVTDTSSVDEAAGLPPKPGEPYHVLYECGPHYLVLRLYGGDSRSASVRASTGGDIPLDFDLEGEAIDLNGNVGLLQTDLNEETLNEMRIASRLIWRLPFVSSEMPSLRALFLALESDGLPDQDLVDTARSVQ